MQAICNAIFQRRDMVKVIELMLWFWFWFRFAACGFANEGTILVRIPYADRPFAREAAAHNCHLNCMLGAVIRVRRTRTFPLQKRTIQYAC